ncbi:MAG: FHA domain-containing protein [Ardenticatenaceae bacterium]|nr:FHA domain-containing protein [Anaerolineales bacterium]MCB8939010.1 FHA domain-containing protein [Ardenticatenaceae bacterium]MCB8974766.1 FHA domain-containing protein [Ardenticatenaceae bacterium]
MIKCTECGSAQEDGALFCSECGGFLIVEPGKITAVLPFSEFANRPPPPPLPEESLAPATQAYKVTLVVPSSRRRFKLEIEDEVQIGRASSELIPEVDLTDDDGAEKGVSRHHAKIQAVQGGLVLVDLGSTNGTLLNNYRLPPQEPFPLKSGDEIRFGDLLIHLFMANPGEN